MRQCPVLAALVLFLIFVSSVSASGPVDANGHRPPVDLRLAEERPAAAERTPATKVSQRLIGVPWEGIGPYGGDVCAVALSPREPQIGLAATEQGLYRSTDGGLSWRLVETLAKFAIVGMEFAPNGDVYAASRFNSVWKSVDDGVTWRQLDLVLAFPFLQTLAVDPSDPDHVWVAGLFIDDGFQMLRSTDGGESWEAVTPPLDAALECNAIVFDPLDGNEVFAAFGNLFGGRIWYTPDAGSSWFNRSGGLPDLSMNALAHDGERLLLGGGLRFGGQGFGVYASSDDGASWSALHDASWTTLAVNAVAFEPGNSRVIYAGTAGAGVFRSTDGGSSWQLSVGESDRLTVKSIRFDPADPSSLLLATRAIGVLQNVGEGGAFENTSFGLSNLNVTSAAASPDGRELAVTFEGLNNGGVYLSPDGGVSWDLASAPATRWDGVTFAPDGTLYALSTGPSSIAPEGVYRREPDGRWVALGPDQGPQFETSLRVLVFSPEDPDLIFAAGSDGFVAGPGATIWRSGDRGASWRKVYESTVDGEEVLDLLIVDDGTGQRAVAAVFSLVGENEGTVVRSEDGGQTWTQAVDGLQPGFQGRALCAHPGAPETLFLGSADNFFPPMSGVLYRSSDGGSSWTVLDDELRVVDLFCDPHDPHRLFVAQGAGVPVVESVNRGRDFTPHAAGLLAANIRRFAYVSGNPEILLLATGSGVFRTPIERLLQVMIGR